jgi:hypothetical protein
MALMAVTLVVVFFAASGFVLTNISDGTEVRADRVTHAVQSAQGTADTLARSRRVGSAATGAGSGRRKGSARRSPTSSAPAPSPR